MNHFEELTYAMQKISLILRHNHFSGCEILRWDSAPNLQVLHDVNGYNLNPDDTYAVVICENGYRYYINITGDSILTACAEVLNFIQYK